MTTFYFMEAYDEEYTAELSNGPDFGGIDSENWKVFVESYCISQDKIEMDIICPEDKGTGELENGTDELAREFPKSFLLEVHPHRHSREGSSYRLVNVRDPIEIKVSKITRKKKNREIITDYFIRRTITVIRAVNQGE